MTNRVFFIVTVTLAVCAAYAGYLLNSKTRSYPQPIAGGIPAAPAPALTSQPLVHWSFGDLDGQERHMSEWAGDVIVVNFWATWCPPCRKEIPEFITLQDRYAGERVQFIGIALDRVDAVRAYAEEQGINYPLLVGEETVAEYMRVLGNTIGALPFSALISRDGRVVATHQGEWKAADVEGAIRAAL